MCTYYFQFSGSGWLSVFMQHKYFFASNLSSSGCSQVCLLFTSRKLSVQWHNVHFCPTCYPWSWWHKHRLTDTKWKCSRLCFCNVHFLTNGLKTAMTIVYPIWIPTYYMMASDASLPAPLSILLWHWSRNKTVLCLKQKLYAAPNNNQQASIFTGVLDVAALGCSHHSINIENVNNGYGDRSACKCTIWNAWSKEQKQILIQALFIYIPSCLCGVE